MNHRTSSMLRKNGKLFGEFLKEEKMTKIKFLLSLGLDIDLIKPYNIEEISKMLDKFLPDDEIFPEITSTDLEFKTDIENISITNSNKDIIVLSDSSIDFYESVDDNVKNIRYSAKYPLNTVKKELNYHILNGENKEIDIDAKETTFSELGEVLDEFAFSANIKNITKLSEYQELFRGIQQASVNNIFNTIYDYMQNNNLTKEDINLKIYNGINRK